MLLANCELLPLLAIRHLPPFDYAQGRFAIGYLLTNSSSEDTRRPISIVKARYHLSRAAA